MTPIPRRSRLIVALDVPTADEARALVERIGDAAVFYKIGLELAMAGGYFELLEWLVKRGNQVFVDLKFFDIPETVARAVAALRGRGVTFATVHGNQAMMEAAGKAKGEVRILAVTALTSLDRGDLDDLGFSCDVERLVLSRARRALEAGVRRGHLLGPRGAAPQGAVQGQAPRRHAGHPPGREPPGNGEFAKAGPEAHGRRRAGLRQRRGLHRGGPAGARRRRPARRRAGDPGHHRHRLSVSALCSGAATSGSCFSG
jgi:hypothetical protein